MGCRETGTMTHARPTPRLPRVTPEGRKRLRVVFFVFLLTFVASRLVVFLIMSRRIPDLYLVLGGTHVHHLNYGIFLLAAVSANLLFLPPTERGMRLATGLFGVGLGLTFDEFGMWLHLGGGYWQRASFDMVVVIAASFGAIVYAPALRRFQPRHWATAALLVVAVASFVAVLVQSLRWADRDLGPEFERLEQDSPR